MIICLNQLPLLWNFKRLIEHALEMFVLFWYGRQATFPWICKDSTREECSRNGVRFITQSAITCTISLCICLRPSSTVHFINMKMIYGKIQMYQKNANAITKT